VSLDHASLPAASVVSTWMDTHYKIHKDIHLVFDGMAEQKESFFL
jgi:hypothetical protein